MKQLDHQTRLSLGLVITLIGAAISFGVMYQKVEHLFGVTTKIETRVDALYNYVFEKEGRTAAK
ncbi:hypothetical protein FBR05_00190 [Deltaproteobacteria bacterium PRO3]|nr:hypothetical protein [Deltaproteobacteria bacterium PRO3]